MCRLFAPALGATSCSQSCGPILFYHRIPVANFILSLCLLPGAAYRTPSTSFHRHTTTQLPWHEIANPPDSCVCKYFLTPVSNHLLHPKEILPSIFKP
eukprot:g36586.t1